MSTATRADRDDALIRFAEGLVEAARSKWGDGFVTETNAPGNPVQRYSETHYALAAALLGVETGIDELFELAAARLDLWDRGGGPMTFFNSMAVCLTAIELDRARRDPVRLRAVIRRLLERTRDHEHVAFRQWCGNNAYLQQVVVDTVLAPLARGLQTESARIRHLVEEFDRFRTPEGFFFDLPRTGNEHERLCPPAYVMKMLFLAGVTHELTGDSDLGARFTSGMAAMLPLLTEDGQAAYFGRTDNSPFAAGLTVFNLRRAASAIVERGADFDRASRDAERYYLSFPRTEEGLLRCNRFGDAASDDELQRASDHYAYVGQYSLASCAYVLLALRWFPDRGTRTSPAQAGGPGQPALSHDLGVAKLRVGESSVVMRTSGQLTARDRRYQGPTILRMRHGSLLVGAPPVTVSSDLPATPGSRVGRLAALLRRRFADGFEELDGTSVGFVPVLRRGRFDFLPGPAGACSVGPTWVRASYPFVRLEARGWRPLATEAWGLVRSRIRWLEPRRHIAPPLRPAPNLRLERLVSLENGRCVLEDRITGGLADALLIFSVRSFPALRVQVAGLSRGPSQIVWGSDGRQTLTYFQARGSMEIRYVCALETDGSLGA